MVVKKLWGNANTRFINHWCYVYTQKKELIKQYNKGTILLRIDELAFVGTRKYA